MHVVNNNSKSLLQIQQYPEGACLNAQSHSKEGTVVSSECLGLGGLQVLATAAVIGVLALAVGAGREAALIVGFGLALSSTALVLQVLAERKELGTPAGRAGLSVLLLQDVAVAPLVSLVYFLGPDDPNASAQDPLLGIPRGVTHANV